MNIDLEKPNFKKLCFLNMQRLTNFPYIEADFDALTNYEMLCKVVEYLNNVIANQNTTNETVEELYDAFTTLKDYVDDYFENLDVQDEINNKLDEMTENGELTNLIKNYIDPIQQSFEENVNEVLGSMQNQINSVASGSPLVASSTSGMTDTTRTYVNTTDGKWYYYNGSSWVAGGTYQSTGLADESVELVNLTDFKNDLYTVETADDIGWVTLGCYNGNYVGSNDVISSEKIRQYKGQVITFSDTYTIRINLYDLNWNYISNTGNFRTMESYTVPQDCYLVISLGGSGTPVPVSAGNSTNVQLKQYNSKNYFEIIKSKFDKVMFRSSDTSWQVGNNYYRYTTTKVLKAKEDLKFSLLNTTNISYSILKFNSSDYSDLLNDSGWITATTIIPKDTYFICAIRYNDWTLPDFNLLNSLLITNIYSLSEINSKIDQTEYVYGYFGDKLDMNNHGYNVEQLYQLVEGHEGICEGFAVYNNILFQATADSYLKLYNYTNGEYLTAFSYYGDHGDVLEFSNEFYDENDEFPLLYANSDSTPNKVYVNRVTRSSATLIRTYLFPADKTGYYAGQATDFENNIMYTIGYSANSFLDSTNNHMIVSKWNLSNTTTNGDGSLTPEFIESFDIPFIECCQGQRYFNNKIYIVSSSWQNRLTTGGNIYVLDIGQKKIVTSLTNFPDTLKHAESEGIEFILSNGKYYAIVGTSSRLFFRIDFQ